MAFGAITALSSLALYISYFIAISSASLHLLLLLVIEKAKTTCYYLPYTHGGVLTIIGMLYARYSHGSNLKLGEWNWGRWGVYINVFALVYTAYMSIWLPFPSTLPVTAANMNYSGPILVLMLTVAVLLWLSWARTNWTGPNLTIMNFIVATS